MSSFGKTMDEQNQGRSEAEFLAELAAQVEPDEYWINVFWDHRRKCLVSETNFTSVADAYDDLLAGYSGCQYLRTIHVSKSASRLVPPDVSAFNLEDDASAWAKDEANG